MQLHRKLSNWQQAGLIDEQVAQNILAFEESSSKPIVLWAAGGLGAFAIIAGIVSVIAANWLHTPDEVKLGFDLVLCAVLGFVVYKTCVNVTASKERLWLREIMVIIYYGFTLASMGLIGQTYQLGGSIAKLLLVWMIATIPLVLLARGKFIAVLWGVSAAITYAMNVPAFNEFALRTLGVDQRHAISIIVTLTIIGPLLFIYLSRIPWLVKNRPIYAKELSRLSWLVIIAAGFFAQFLWYQSNTINEVPNIVFLITGIVIGITIYLIPALYKGSDTDAHLAMRIVLLVVFLLIFSAFWHVSSMNVVGALTNLVYLLILAWAALKIRSTFLFNVLTAAISLRILFIYFEVFGSMMQTGLGLIIGGILTLLLAWAWFKKSASLATHLTKNGHL